MPLMIAMLIAGAQPAPNQAAQQRPQPLAALMSCRAVRGGQERLACVDAALAALEKAEVEGAFLGIDPRLLRREQRELFGLSNIRLPPAINTAQEEVQEISSTVARLRDLGFGLWVVELAQGGTWRMKEQSRHIPSVGDPVKIERGALGSFFMSIAGKRGIRSERIR